MKDLDVKKIQPTKGYVLVEPAKAEEKTKSGIILSESDSEKPQYGVVLAVGESGCCCDEDCCESEDCCSDGEGCCDSEGCCGGGCDCESDEKETEKDSKKSKASEKSEEKEEDFECCGGHCHDCEDDGEEDSEEDSEEVCCSDEEGCCSDGAYFDCECDCDCEISPVKVGDKVIYKKWGGNEFKIGDTEYQFLKFEDILAVIND